MSTFRELIHVKSGTPPSRTGRVFNKAMDLAASGGSRLSTSMSTHEVGSSLLHNSIVPSGLHNSGERCGTPRCHPDTRMAILNDIMAWVKDLNRMFPVRWLYGSAGAGKSTIAQMIAEMCERDGFLTASFFFACHVPGRNNARHLVATIAHQLGVAIPGIQADIEKTVEEDQSIFSRSLNTQVERLLVRPLRRLPRVKNGNHHPQLIIIDGLDECKNSKTQCEFLRLVCRIINAAPTPIAFLVASRPESHILQEFNRGELSRKALPFRLFDTSEAYHDIELFIWEKFREVKKLHPLSSSIPNSWPPYDVIETLLQKSPGYISMAMKFVGSPRHNPTCRLDIIRGQMNVGHESPHADFDFLYSSILLYAENVDRVLEILGALTIPQKPAVRRLVSDSRYGIRNPEVEFYMLDINFLEDLLSRNPGDVMLGILDLSPVIEVSKDKKIHICHPSFLDFLADPSRSGNLHLQDSKVHETIALQCLRNLPLQGGKRLGLQAFMEFWAIPHFEQADLSERLHQEILYFDVARLCSAPSYWLGRHLFNFNFWVSAPQFLDFVKATKFPDKDAIFAAQRQAYEKFVMSRLQVYFAGDQRLVDLLVMVCFCDDFRNPAFVDWIVHVILDDSGILVKADRESGLQLLQFCRWNLNTYHIQPGYRWRLYLEEFLHDCRRAGMYFLSPRDVASVTLRCVKHAVMMERQAELMFSGCTHHCRLLRDYSLVVFPQLLGYSAVTEDLVKVLMDEFPDLLRLPHVEEAIQKYLERSRLPVKAQEPPKKQWGLKYVNEMG